MSCSFCMLSSFFSTFQSNLKLYTGVRSSRTNCIKKPQPKPKTKPTKKPQNFSFEAQSCHSSGLCKQCGLTFGHVFSPLFYHPHLSDVLFSCMMCVSLTFPHTGMKMALCGFGMHLVSAYISFIS